MPRASLFSSSSPTPDETIPDWRDAIQKRLDFHPSR
jgi:hypothetical protein